MVKYKKEKIFSNKLIPLPTTPKPVEVKPQTFFRTLLQRIQIALNLVDRKNEQRLAGRIHELDSHARLFFKQLESIKKELQKDKDCDSYTFIDAIVEPLLKELPLITKNLHSSKAALQAKSFKQYGEWIDKAKVWVQFYQKVDSKKEIIDAVVSYLIGETLLQIERDLQIIQEYRRQYVETLALSSFEKEELKETIDRGLQPYLEQLTHLKTRPAGIDRDQLSCWKVKIDEQRQKLFNDALHAIESFSETPSPIFNSPEAVEHLQEVIAEINYLERELFELEHDIDEFEQHKVEGSHSVQRLLLAHLISLEEQTHQMTMDMRLGWDLVARLEAVMEKIKRGRKKLTSE